MALVSANVVVAQTGFFRVAPVGTTAPGDAVAAPDAAFVDLGFIGEDGAILTVGREVTDVRAWQALDPIRKIMTARTVRVAAALREWKRATAIFAFGGGTVTGSAGDWEFTPAGAGVLDPRSSILDWEDGTKHYRLWIAKGMAVENVDSNLTRSGPADLPFTFDAEFDGTNSIFKLFTDDPAFA